ncbi:RsmB/NOP family class I SAM-dependent RNA methyltransferase [Pleomorphovibrio marinus]|uniref:RsmB/NOP family class I SAM-dependent RNA methyltransferase n=1 Tax=Pleomorphovibrio marinus TaxID=2164132 RepID=UPI000E09ED26|nr:RsmB/NOP family class I SAM-dependent RNA methyltransferase [Pleomorphovibrio marinus]
MVNKLHSNTVRGVVESLASIFEGGYYSDKVIERTFKENPKWGARDRGFVAETVYDMVRWWRFIKEISPSEDYYHLFASYWIWMGNDLPFWKEFQAVNKGEVLEKASKIRERALLESIPDWLDEIGSQQLGARWENELHAQNQQAEVVLRVNTLKTSREELAKLLLEEGVETYSLKEYPDALVLQERQNIFKSSYFKKGFFEVQDASSQKVAMALAPEPGMRVIDACAGAGGKSLHLAALMQNKGRILAMDLKEWKLKNTKLRARRGGITIIETREISGSKTIKRLKESADRLLIDAPCSGLGVLRRNPDTKWKLSSAQLEKVLQIQEDLLRDYSRMLKPGGILVYATCSILPMENQDQVNRFLESEAGKGFTLEEEQKVLAHESGFDGFYIAKLQKAG